MENSEEPMTSITIKVSTRDRLKALGRKGESYGDVIELLLDHKPKKWRKDLIPGE
jgi:predicted CopG family antitoxin